MKNNTSTFVSPGVYTREVDMSFVTSSVGITTLGVVGETLKGPAFEPIAISNKEEFFVRFGGQSTEKFANGVPKYELPYIANSYLEESNQLYVTRILGLSGYDAGKAWVIKTTSGDTVAILRSRAEYVNDTLTFKTSGVTMSGTGATINPLASFTLVAGGETTIVSLDESKQDFISKVLGVSQKDKKSAIMVEEVYPNLLKSLIATSGATGLNLTVTSITNLNNYKTSFQTPETPFIVSEIRGNKVEKLFKFISISDGADANKEIKISFENLNFDTKEFDVIIRAFSDTDAAPKVLEAHRRCSMNPKLNSFIGKRIGTFNGDYELYSKFVTVVLDENAPIDSLPAGFEGYVIGNGTGVKSLYKTSYGIQEKVKKTYLGISNIVGIDDTLFNYHGVNISSATTKGFHMDINAGTGYTVGAVAFTSEAVLLGTALESLATRKFTVAPAGGFDGWDIYRNNRTNSDDFRIFQPKFSGFTESLPSDYYAYLQGIETFANPDDMYINLFATPGIDYDRQNALVKETIEMIEEKRADSLYVVTTPDQPATASAAQNMVNILDAADIDSSYTTTFAPWVQIEDNQNGSNIFLPPTFEYLRLAAQTDNIKAPWFTTAGYQRGQLKAKKTRVKINQETAEILYSGRINPIRSFPQSPLLIFGNRNLQITNSALDRNNVRRLFLQVRKLVSAVAVRLVFEPNDVELQAQFLNLVNPILASVKQQRGVTDFRVICDDVLNTSDTRDRLELRGKIQIKPTKSAEFIDIEFGVTSDGASFNDI